MSAVYFARSLANGSIKIGFSKRPSIRVSRFSTIMPGGAELLGVAAGDLTLEKRLHEELKEHRLNGEWFSDNPVVRVVIARTLAESGCPIDHSVINSKADVYTNQASEWMRYLNRRIANRLSVTVKEARGDIAQQTGISEGLAFNLTYNRALSINVVDYEKLRLTAIREFSTEIEQLTQELRVVKEFAKGHFAAPDAASVRRLKAVIDDANALLSEMTGGRS